MDLLKNFPEEWYVMLNDFNDDELLLASKFRKKINSNEEYISYNLSDKNVISNLINDGSYFESDIFFYSNDRTWGRPNTVKLTKEKFLELISETPKTETMDKLKQINIGYDLLKEYYEASTGSQKEFIDKHFKINGDTTIGAIIGLHDIACENWKSKIKSNHPECFDDGKYFDFGLVRDSFYHDEKTQKNLSKIGLESYVGQIRCAGEYKDKGIVLDRPDKFARANWEIVDDGVHIIAVPTRIKK